jgi:pimeloyl-ACP methyl ester carboxylesterase
MVVPTHPRVAEPATPASPATDLWDLRRFGPTPPDATGAVLLLPGALCTAAFYDDVVADPRVASGDTGWIEATPPGFGGLPVADGFVPTVEAYAELTGDLAAEVGAHTIVAHSYFANVAIEMAVTGRFSGQLVLLSPCFAASDEESDTRMFARLARIPGVGRVVWGLLPKLMGVGMKGRFPAAAQDRLVAEMRRFNGGITRRLVRHYFAHLEAHAGSIATRLCGSGVTAWLVRGSDDEVGLCDTERRKLESCPRVSLITVPDARHFVMADQPGAVVDVALRALPRRDVS